MHQILRSWREIKIMLKWRFSTLSDEDFHYEEGEKEKMYAQLRRKVGKTKEEFERILADIQRF